MTRFSRQVTLKYSPDQMYDLVNDVSAYASFIPLCSRSEVHEKSDNKLTATIAIAKGRVGFSFTTLNRMEKGQQISMQLVSGPFKSLTGLWKFNPSASDGCLVSVEFDFEFANKLLAVAFSQIFTQVCESMIEAFKKQAKVRYDHL